jgi:hypothetical protein
LAAGGAKKLASSAADKVKAGAKDAASAVEDEVLKAAGVVKHSSTKAGAWALTKALNGVLIHTPIVQNALGDVAHMVIQSYFSNPIASPPVFDLSCGFKVPRTIAYTGVKLPAFLNAARTSYTGARDQCSCMQVEGCKWDEKACGDSGGKTGRCVPDEVEPLKLYRQSDVADSNWLPFLLMQTVAGARVGRTYERTQDNVQIVTFDSKKKNCLQSVGHGLTGSQLEEKCITPTFPKHSNRLLWEPSATINAFGFDHIKIKLTSNYDVVSRGAITIETDIKGLRGTVEMHNEWLKKLSVSRLKIVSKEVMNNLNGKMTLKRESRVKDWKFSENKATTSFWSTLCRGCIEFENTAAHLKRNLKRMVRNTDLDFNTGEEKCTWCLKSVVQNAAKGSVPKEGTLDEKV